MNSSIPRDPTAWVDFEDPLVPSGPRLRWRLHEAARWLVAHEAAKVPDLLDMAHDWGSKGGWAVGWVAYEAAPGFDPALSVKALEPGQVYAAWALFEPEQVQPWSAGEIAAQEHLDNRAAQDAGSVWHAGPWTAGLERSAFDSRLARINELIREGEVYQINLTDQNTAPFAGDAMGVLAYFDALRRAQGGGYGLLLDARAVSHAPGWLLSASPELFFDWHEGVLTTRPMKGTAPRGLDGEQDRQAASNLRQSAKERAENLMIVDLLRNDVSKVAQTGSVRVSTLFDVQAWPTVWQMTSTITARAREGLRLSEVFAALFPCGSVTGAPKRRAMHHIAQLEWQSRGVYCGAVGLMQPGGRVTCNVPIRTVCLHTPAPPATWRAQCGIGSGITLDATAPSEWREWAAKRAFLMRAEAPFEILESLRLEQGHLARRQAHVERMLASARHFQWPVSTNWAARIQQTLDGIEAQYPSGILKVRLLLAPSGRIRCEAYALPPMLSDVVALADHAMPEANDFVRHKTTRRDSYAAFMPKPGCADTLLVNSHGEFTEFTMGNVALQLDGEWVTPPLSCGLLPGVMRAELISQGRLRERVVHRDELPSVHGLALVNSVRGWTTVHFQTHTT